MSVTLSSKMLPIRSRPMAKAVAGPSSPLSRSGKLSTTGIIPRDRVPCGEHGAGGAEVDYISPEPPLDAKASTLALENLEQMEGRTLLATLASVVARSDNFSLSSSVTGPDLHMRDPR